MPDADMDSAEFLAADAKAVEAAQRRPQARTPGTIGASVTDYLASK